MIRKLKILISHKERELKSCHPNARDRVRDQLKALVKALEMAKQERDLKRLAA